MMRSVAFIAFTRNGCELAQTISGALAASASYGRTTFSVSGPARFAATTGVEPYEGLADWTATHFASDDALVFVGASGIAVRAIAPHVKDKFSDPAVVSIDEAGRFAVPLLSGHVGGANELARDVAEAAGGQAAVSTATDVNDMFAVDEWAARRGLVILEREVAKEISAALLEGHEVGFQTDFDFGWQPPAGIVEGSADAQVGFVISLGVAVSPWPRTLHLVPRILTVGVGCRKGASPQALADAVREALADAGASPRAVRMLASIDVKCAEPAILELAEVEGWELRFYTADELACVPGEFAHSDFVERTVGVGNVCERAACAEGAALLIGKRTGDGVTVAIAQDLAKGSVLRRS